MKTLLLQEDDCTPDARQYFEKNFLEMFGMELHEFIHESKTYWTDDEMQCNHELDNIVVIFREDEKGMSVYKITEYE